MKKCLFICSHFPSNKAHYAGHKSAYNILMDYLNSGFEVDLIILANSNEFRIDVFDKYENINVVHSEKLNIFKKIKNLIISKKFFPLKVNSRYSNKIINFYIQNNQEYSVVHFEFTASTSILSKIKKFAPEHTKFHLSIHDVLFQGLLRKANKYLYLIDLIETYRFEKFIFNNVNKIIAHNSKDKELLTSLYSINDEKIEIKYPTLSNFVYAVSNKRQKFNQKKVLLFWGAMDRTENVEAVLNFWKLYKDLIIQKNYILYVVGANPHKKLLNINHNKFIVTGYVEDPSEYFIKAKYGIVPLLSGAGIKVKTLEMLAAGLPVISTSIGAEGVEKSASLFISDISDFGSFL